MKRVLTAVILIPVVLLVVFKAPLWVFAAVTALFAILASYEYLELIKGFGITPIKWPTLAIIACIFVCSVVLAWVFPGEALGDELRSWVVFAKSLQQALQLFGPLALVATALRGPDLRKSVSGAVFSALAIPYIASTLVELPFLRGYDGPFLILVLFVAVWSGDIFAYYVGKNFGRHKLAPTVSPNKTWEGAIASVFGSVLCGWGLYVLRNREPSFFDAVDPLSSTVAGVCNFLFFLVLINVAAQIGDLAESMIKRGAGIKDSGNILPGHGGVLDRIDALLFAIPVVSFYSSIGITFQ